MWRGLRTAVLTWILGVRALLAQAGGQDSRSRTDLLRELALAERAAAAPAATDAIRVAHARLLYQAGEFWRARDLLQALAAGASAPVEAVELAARLEFLTGDYQAADHLFDRAMAAHEGTPSKRVGAMVGKFLSLYQRNRFQDIGALQFPAGVQIPNVTLARQFDQAPYQIDWPAGPRRIEIPFKATDPLPQLGIEVNGVPLNVLFDTGGDILILDDEVARSLGVVPVATAKGEFGGGLSGAIGFGKVDRMTVGGVTIRQVPVMTMPARRFTMNPAIPISGIVGTALMRQFLGTVDYRRGSLVLRERTSASAEAVRRELAGRLAAEVPFVLDATHQMYARVGVDDRDGLTFFIDSGLAMDAVVALPPQTLEYLGIPKPKMEIPKESVGGGGGKFASGLFPLRSVALGPLRQTGVRGEAGALAVSTYWAKGFIADGLLSHGFLRRYGSWTIDFDAMTYLFETP